MMTRRSRNKSKDLSKRGFIKNMRLFDLALMCLYIRAKYVIKYLKAIEGNVSIKPKIQRDFKRRSISARKELKEELGCLLISLGTGCTDDERRRYLKFIESTLKHYINLSEKI